MRKLSIPTLLLVLFLLTASAAGDVEIQPNPNNSSRSEYTGNWELYPSRAWRLIIGEDGSFIMHNDTQILDGSWEFLPSPFSQFSDSLWMDLDPPGYNDSDFHLSNTGSALVDSDHGFVFVRPGREPGEIKKEEGVFYSLEDMVGDWMLVGAHVVAGPLEMTFTAEELLAGSGEKHVILNFDGGHLNCISSVKEMTIRTVPVTYKANIISFFNPDSGLTHLCYFTGPDTMYMKAYPEPTETTGRFDFVRIKEVPKVD